MTFFLGGLQLSTLAYLMNKSSSLKFKNVVRGQARGNTCFKSLLPIVACNLSYFKKCKYLFASLLKPKPSTPKIPTVPPKLVIILHGEPSITCKTSEVGSLIIKENLHYVIIGEFSYGKPDVKVLRKTIPGQCEIKSECMIDVLDTSHILIRLTTMEDYVHLLSTVTFHVNGKESY